MEYTTHLTNQKLKKTLNIIYEYGQQFLARVHFSLNPTDHKLGTLSTPIETTTEIEQGKRLFGACIFILSYFVFLHYLSSYLHITHLRPIL